MPNQNMTELVVELQKLEHPDGTPLLSPDMIQLLANGLHHSHLPDTLHPAAAEAFQRTFELIGGLPRLALWADRYPAQFYKLFARQTIPTIAPVLPAPQEANTQEWPAWLTQRRLAYQEEGFHITQQDTDTDKDAD